MDSQTRALIKNKINERKREQIKFESMGRRIRSMAEAQQEEEERLKRDYDRKNRWSEDKIEARRLEFDLRAINNLEVRCALCLKISSKFANSAFQHEKHCIHYEERIRLK